MAHQLRGFASFWIDTVLGCCVFPHSILAHIVSRYYRHDFHRALMAHLSLFTISLSCLRTTLMTDARGYGQALGLSGRLSLDTSLLHYGVTSAWIVAFLTLGVLIAWTVGGSVHK
jgi:hypothetical protein